MPSATTFKIMNGIHRSIFKASRGRLMGKFYGMPVLVLTTTGRKSGRKIETMLTSPVQDGDKVIVIASKGGDPKHPAWFLNLRDNPHVEVLMEGRNRPMRARIASPEEKNELWPRVTGQYKGYGQYQTKTSRDIPVVILEPVSG